MAPIRVVLDAQNFSDDALVRVVRQLVRESRWLEILGLEPHRLETLRARIGRRLSQRIRPVQASNQDTVYVPAPYNFAAGTIIRLQRQRGSVVRVYVPGCSPSLAVTRWLGGALPADGGFPDYTCDNSEDDNGLHRVWVRGDEVGVKVFTPEHTSVASLYDGVVLTVRGGLSRWVRPLAGRIKRAVSRSR